MTEISLSKAKALAALSHRDVAVGQVLYFDKQQDASSAAFVLGIGATEADAKADAETQAKMLSIPDGQLECAAYKVV